MKNNRLLISVIPLLVIVSLNLVIQQAVIEGNENDLYNNSNTISQSATDELIVTEINFIDESVKINAPSCSENLSLACPCGGHCEADPGNVCTLCSEWETQKKFVKCEKEVVVE